MIFAIIDYFQYRSARGKYGDSQVDGGMCLAFMDVIPCSVMEQLNPGDLIFTQRLNSLKSWMMMYFTSAPIDHMGIYAGDGKIGHMTLEGVKIHSLRAVATGTRILICRIGVEAHRWIEIVNAKKPQIDTGNFIMHMLPPKAQLALGGVWTVCGKYPNRIKWWIILDVLFLCATVDIIAYFAIGNHLGLVLALLYLLSLVFYQISNFFFRKRNGFHRIISHPDLGYYAFFDAGGLMFTKQFPIVVSDLGLVPLKVILRLARKGSDDSSNNEFEKARQFFSDLIEGWNLHPKTKQAEEDDSEKHENKKTHEGTDDPR